jgi:hypothetical protein
MLEAQHSVLVKLGRFPKAHSLRLIHDSQRIAQTARCRKS